MVASRGSYVGGLGLLAELPLLDRSVAHILPKGSGGTKVPFIYRF